MPKVYKTDEETGLRAFEYRTIKGDARFMAIEPAIAKFHADAMTWLRNLGESEIELTYGGQWVALIGESVVAYGSRSYVQGVVNRQDERSRDMILLAYVSKAGERVTAPSGPPFPKEIAQDIDLSTRVEKLERVVAMMDEIVNTIENERLTEKHKPANNDTFMLSRRMDDLERRFGARMSRSAEENLDLRLDVIEQDLRGLHMKTGTKEECQSLSDRLDELRSRVDDLPYDDDRNLGTRIVLVENSLKFFTKLHNEVIGRVEAIESKIDEVIQ